MTISLFCFIFHDNIYFDAHWKHLKTFQKSSHNNRDGRKSRKQYALTFATGEFDAVSLCQKKICPGMVDE